MKKISILGCGWLGFPLAQHFIQNGFQIKGSTTTFEKVKILEAESITAFQIELHEDKIIGSIAEFLKDSEILILDIPPKLRSVVKENFVKKIQTLLPYIEQSTIKKVLFVSSTSAFADNNQIVTDETLPNPDTESGKQLVEVEQLLMSQTAFETTVLRFGGLIGKNRHPIHFLAGRSNIENPDAPVNLIHLQDCIGIINKIIHLEYWNTTLNAAVTEHPTKKEYYTQKALELNLPVPHFNLDKPSVGKTISSEKILKELEYKFTMSI